MTEPAETRYRPARRLCVTAVSALLVVLGALTALTVYAMYASDPPSHRLALDLTVAIAGWALSPLLLWRPVTSALGLALLAALSPAATPAATAGALQVAKTRPLPIAVAVAVVGVAAHVVQATWRSTGWLSFSWWIVLITLAYGALVGWGALWQSRRALIMSLHDRARRAEREQGRRVAEARILERTQLAREMHDVLAHRLSLLATYAGALEYRPDSSPERLAQAAGVVRDGAHQALDELRQVIAVLRDDDDDMDGNRPQPGIADLPRLVDESRAAGMLVELALDVTPADTVPGLTARTSYRVVQEGLTNARRHAAGRRVRVRVEGRPGDGVDLELTNELADHAGTATTAPGGGSGLVGLTERTHLAGGRLDFEVDDGRFVLHAWLPWPA